MIIPTKDIMYIIAALGIAAMGIIGMLKEDRQPEKKE